MELDKYAGRQLPGIGTKKRSCFTWSRAARNMTRLREGLLLRPALGAL
ncbi:MAG: hypothetical protein ACLR0U_10490 [Enterocloster clostridioformis]